MRARAWPTPARAHRLASSRHPAPACNERADVRTVTRWCRSVHERAGSPHPARTQSLRAFTSSKGGGLCTRLTSAMRMPNCGMPSCSIGALLLLPPLLGRGATRGIGWPPASAVPAKKAAASRCGLPAFCLQCLNRVSRERQQLGSPSLDARQLSSRCAASEGGEKRASRSSILIPRASAARGSAQHAAVARRGERASTPPSVRIRSLCPPAPAVHIAAPAGAQ